jgi:hypothetical protein
MESVTILLLRLLLLNYDFSAKSPAFPSASFIPPFILEFSPTCHKGSKMSAIQLRSTSLLTEGEQFVRGIKLSVQDPKNSGHDLEITGPKRVHHEDTFELRETQESERYNPPSKRSRLNASSGSRMEELILHWLDASEPRKAEDGCGEVCQLPKKGYSCPKIGATDQVKQPKREGQSSIANDSLFPHDAPRALFVVRFKDDIGSQDLSVELFREWLRSIPAAAEEVRVEAGFKCFSTLIFITMPLSMCSYIPRHQAVYFLGTVRSSIMLPLEEPQTTPFRDGDEISSSASTTGPTAGAAAAAAYPTPASMTSPSNAPTPKIISSYKARRASRPKVKTGCNNCKSRRVKCDEMRPQCTICVRSGRVCDGYPAYKRLSERNRALLPTPPAPIAPSTSAASLTSIVVRNFDELPIQKFLPTPRQTPGSHPFLLKPSPSGFLLNPQESKFFQFFQFFQTHTAIELSGVFDTNFWTRTVLRASHSELSILHMVIALGALSKSLEISEFRPGLLDDKASPPNHYNFALQQYGRALTQLRKSLQDNEGGSQRTVFICIVLFTCFQSITGDHKAVISQIKHGLGLLEERRQESKSPLSRDDPIEDELIRIFTRLAIQAKLYNTIFHFPPPYEIRFTPTLPDIILPEASLAPLAAASPSLDIEIPEVFETAVAARTALDSLCEYILRSKETISNNSPPSIAKSFSLNFTVQLAQWSGAFESLL